MEARGIEREQSIPLLYAVRAPEGRLKELPVAVRVAPPAALKRPAGARKNKEEGALGRFRSTAWRPWLEYTPPLRGSCLAIRGTQHGFRFSALREPQGGPSLVEGPISPCLMLDPLGVPVPLKDPSRRDPVGVRAGDI